MDGYPRRRIVVGWSVDRSVGLVFISPEVQDQQRAEKVQDQQQPPELKARGRGRVGRPNTRHRLPRSGGRSVGRSARWQEDGTVPADLPARIYLQWVMTRRGRSGPVPPGAASPRPAKSVCHVSPSRTIHSYCPDEFGWARRSPVRERERERPESCPARPLRRTHCRTIFLAGAAGQTVHSEALSVGARPGRHGPFSAACCRPPACGGPAGRTHLQTDHFLSGGEFYHSKCENFLSHIISASFRPHIFPIISVVVDR